ncbi:MAG: class I SAM-dependent methyltransferase [Promethearchaeota archaeon]|jgi:18S rRNA (guanine1575-N7)-methyltransferase
MERNQKKTTLLSIEYLFDKKLQENEKGGIQMEDSFLILDLGCGTGFSSEILIENNFNVIGVDILSDMLKKAREKKKFIKNKRMRGLILADIRYLPFKINIVDHIISISSYNFILHGKDGYSESAALLNNTARYLKKILKTKGRVIIEFYPKNEKELNLFNKSFINNGFKGYMVKNNPSQKSGQTFLLLKKRD